MQTYQVRIQDRNYTNWDICDLSNNSIIENREQCNPLINKLLTIKPN